MKQSRKPNTKRFEVENGWQTGIWVVLCLFLFGEVLFCTWCRVQYLKTGYALTQAKEHNQALTERQKILRIELASLKSPERISRIAREKLNLVAPDVDRMVTIKP